MLFLVAVVVLLMLVGVGHVSYQQGAQPLRKLKPGKYHVEAVLHAGEYEIMFVVSWHVDHGLYEYRLVRLKRGLLQMTPVGGDEITVSKYSRFSYEGRESKLVYTISGGRHLKPAYPAS